MLNHQKTTQPDQEQCETRKNGPGRKTPFRSFDEADAQCRECHDRKDLARDIKAAAVWVGGLRNTDHPKRAGSGGDRKNCPEKTAPAERVDEDAADSGADRHREPIHPAPDRNRSSPLGRIRIGQVKNGEGDRQLEGCAEPGHSTA